MLIPTALTLTLLLPHTSPSLPRPVLSARVWRPKVSRALQESIRESQALVEQWNRLEGRPRHPADNPDWPGHHHQQTHRERRRKRD